MKQRIWDISQRLHPGVPVWPGDTPFGGEQTWKMADGSPVNVSRLTLSTHTGAHADAPLHYSQDGADIASVDLTPYLGKCLVVDARKAVGLIQESDLPNLLGITRILLRTYERFPHTQWEEDFTAISPEAIRWLAMHGVTLIGIDTPSIDPQNSKSMDAHNAVLRADIRVLEGLVLDDVEAGIYELIALPLPIEGGDASPVRAVLRELP
ncbi:arylformamidase [Altererythrobacter aquiaggeris]|uniref:arylformamidase n=1 Tax=Aestuarierythrobacter aquiaggeris TaxID=1898396 RepID=UPI003016CEC4